MRVEDPPTSPFAVDDEEAIGRDLEVFRDEGGVSVVVDADLLAKGGMAREGEEILLAADEEEWEE